MRINEIFGPTVQGEGPMTGRRCAFIRFAECNLACSWCDTPYTWDWENYDRSKESVSVTAAQVMEQVQAMNVSCIVITGGEPMMQQEAFTELHDLAPDAMYSVETNGTIIPSLGALETIDLFVVSPKLGHAGNLLKKSLKHNALQAFAELTHDGQAAFKWVVRDESDIADIQAFNASYSVRDGATWLMPLGASRIEHVANLIDLADTIIDAGFNISTRLHVIAWDQLRGV